MRIRRVLVLSVLLLCVALPTTRAAEGRIPIYEPIVLDGNTAKIEGKYTVVRNIEAVDGFAIEINGTGSERIEINLNGFNVGRSGETVGGVIRVMNVRSLVLENGSVTSTAASGNVVRVENAASAGEVVVERLKVSGGGTGIKLDDVPNFRITHNIVTGTASHAIQAVGDAGLTIGGLVENNQVRGVDKFGIWIGDAASKPVGLIVRGNRVEGAGTDGILVKFGRSFVIEANTIADSGNVGLKVQSGQTGRIEGNTVSGSGLDTGAAGIVVINDAAPSVSANLLIAGNVSSGNVGNGLGVDGTGHRIFDNVLNDNGGAGFRLVGDDITFGANTARNNAGGPTCTTPPPGACGSPDFCDSGNNNSSFGSNFMPGGC